MRALRLATLSVLLAAPPARPQEFECPDHGGPPWREMRTVHFSVWTDPSSGKAREMAEEVEQVLELVRHGLFKTPPHMPGVIRVFAPRSKEEFGLFASKNVAGFVALGTAWGPTIVVPGPLGDWGRIRLAHELTHLVASRAFARQPAWFREGLASFMESVGTSGVGATPTVGGVPRHRFASVFPYHGGVASVLRARYQLLGGDARDASRSYALAWALVHFLVNRHPQEFGQLQLRFVKGQEPATAWREVFPQWDPAVPGATDELDGEIGKYLARGSFGYRDVHLPPAPPVTELPLTAADAHDIRLSLPWWNRGEKLPPERLQAEVDEALRHDPGCVAALSLLAGMHPERALALAEEATAAHPDDVRAWLLLAQALPKEAAPRREQALRKAVEAGPASARALNSLAWQLLGTGRSREALPLASKAAGLAPWGAAELDTLVGVLEDLGRCQDALAVERRAVDVLPEGLDEKSRAPYLERLARLQARCGPMAGPAPGAGGK